MERKTISIGITLLAILFLVQSAVASGGSGCIGKPPKPYTCTCPVTNQVERYFGNEDLAAAMKDKNSCCYKAKHYVRPEIMLNPKIGDWVQLNGTYFKLVGISAKSYRDTGEEVITTKTVLVPYNETNEFIEWHRMYDKPVEPITLGPCDSFIENATETTAVEEKMIQTPLGNITAINLTMLINWVML